MTSTKVIDWLLKGDVVIQYQTHRDILESDLNSLKALRTRIQFEGWGKQFLNSLYSNGHGGQGFYQSKWINKHYALLELKNISIAPDNREIKETLSSIFKYEKGPDGGINPSRTIKQSDVCINGMVLNYASYFGVNQANLHSIIDFILLQHMNDGGFNCRFNRKGAVHSSLHSTISVIEGILEYSKNGYSYRLSELQEAENKSREFILQHRLFKSDKTGEIIDNKMLMFSYPSRWRYDVLRALDYFHLGDVPYDPRMQEAIDLIKMKQSADGTWPMQAKYPGEVHFEMEKVGEPSRWNTLRALRILKNSMP
ncbi:hypothetical protein [Desulfosporosinus sp. BICA1-9]|uniref:hypothetical protein n=1 Tax=Desulfosporosinus sp. BICA1-9 TaxID=1531958 RepID=UPI00054C058A|nr:hypothetical protein [Desulfosporosinus sp. BICA1-9]KJS49476.1 MAG: hypothetical protein VR66_08290 [Peptococcaceae bacterium BRH_c23]KJS89028.1 MAG: hypothetical protein JL57_09625 [Desulfosporosinus sp. BICA1-9]HBW35026.1 hypothetical protein [Desulfosporosinus sp.]